MRNLSNKNALTSSKMGALSLGLSLLTLLALSPLGSSVAHANTLHPRGETGRPILEVSPHALPANGAISNAPRSPSRLPSPRIPPSKVPPPRVPPPRFVPPRRPHTPYRIPPSRAPQTHRIQLEDIHWNVLVYMKDLNRCASMHAKAPVELTFRWKIHATGRSSDIAVEAPREQVGSALGRCVAEVIGAVYFPEFYGEPVKILESFRLDPAGKSSAEAPEYLESPGSDALNSGSPKRPVRPPAVAGCRCELVPVQLVCGTDNVTYTSICHATCRGVSVARNGVCGYPR